MSVWLSVGCSTRPLKICGLYCSQKSGHFLWNSSLNYSSIPNYHIHQAMSTRLNYYVINSHTFLIHPLLQWFTTCSYSTHCKCLYLLLHFFFNIFHDQHCNFCSLHVKKIINLKLAVTQHNVVGQWRWLQFLPACALHCLYIT